MADEPKKYLYDRMTPQAPTLATMGDSLGRTLGFLLAFVVLMVLVGLLIWIF